MNPADPVIARGEAPKQPQGCILAVDIGTTALKAALITHTGEAAAYSKQPLTQGDHAALGWLPALERAVESMCVRQAKRSETISAISISGNGPTLVAPDGTTLLWNAPAVGGGQQADGSIFLPRITAFRAMYSAVWASLDSTHPLCSGPEWLAMQLTGRAVTVLPEARYQSAYWDDAALDALGIPRDILPPFVSPTERVGLYNGIPVFCTGPDFIAAMIGTGSLEPGKMYDCAGSSEGVNLVVDDTSVIARAKAETPPSLLVSQKHEHSPKQPLRVLPSVVPGLWNVAVMIPESGSIFVNYRRIVEAVADREVPYSELIDRSLANPDSDGYEILQYIAGNFRDAVRALPRVGDCIVVTGGQARNARWMQMKADVAGVPLAVMRCPDAELMGDAAAALAGLGVYPSLQDAARAICRVALRYTPSEHSVTLTSIGRKWGKSESL